MKRRKLTTHLFVLLLLLLSSANSFSKEKTMREIAEGNNKFGLKLYEQIKSEKENLFFSPYSISTALAMTYAGAREETKAQMAEVMEFHYPHKQLFSGFSQIDSLLNNVQKKGDVELSTANALWVQKGYKILVEFTKTVKKYFKSAFQTLDFEKAPLKAVKEINKWVEEKTKDKIKNLLKKNNINSLTRLVLTNAIYFKGMWAYKFDENLTRDLPFWIKEKESIKTPMMFIQEDFKYVETKSTQILELPYKGKDLSMIIILPKKISDINQIENIIEKEKLFSVKKISQEVKVYLPKFEITKRYKLTEVLKNMGMTAAFNYKEANFSGITKNNDLFISDVFHKAFIKVDEKGTEAAAATAVVMELKSVNPAYIKEFKADHPFLFYIQDNESGNILFMGRINKL